MKLNISLDEKLVERMEDVMDELYLNRSGLISLALSQFFDQREMMNCVKRMSFACQKIADSGTIDDAVKAELDDLYRLANLFMKKQ